MPTILRGGIFVHSFLNVFDYHRQHAPASGKILEAKFIPGQVYLEVELDVLDAEERANENSGLANAVIPRRYLDAQDATGYQFVQCRGLFVLETAIGKVAILPMGMAQVSSVVFVKPGTQELIRLSEKEKKGLSYDEQVKLLNEKVHKEVVGKTVSKGEMITTFLSPEYVSSNREDSSFSLTSSGRGKVSSGQADLLPAPSPDMPTPQRDTRGLTASQTRLQLRVPHRAAAFYGRFRRSGKLRNKNSLLPDP